MCLVPKDSAKIAEEDIIVYKILLKYLDGSYISPFKGMPYQIGELKTASIKYKDYIRTIFDFSFRGQIIDEGLHAYTTKGSAIGVAFHIPMVTAVVKAVIPKGATYVLGTGNEIVSTQLKLIEECH